MKRNAQLDSDSDGELRPKEVATLVYLRRSQRIRGSVDTPERSEVLLIRKLRGHGAGKINAPGGHVEAGESILNCARREVFEEVGLRLEKLALVGRLRFRDTGNGFNMCTHIVLGDAGDGEARASAEAEPFWCAIDRIPYGCMWEGDRFWLPRILAGERLQGDFRFHNDRLLRHRVAALLFD